MSQRKMFIIIGVLLFLVTSLLVGRHLLQNYALKQEDRTLRTVFGLSGATLQEIQLNQWLQITELFASNEAAEEYAKEVGKRIYGTNHFTIKSEETGEYSQITLTGLNKDNFNTSFSLLYKLNERDNRVVFTLLDRPSLLSRVSLEESMDDLVGIIYRYYANQHRSVIYKGDIKGAKSEKFYRTFTANSSKILKSKEMDRLEFDNVESVSAYSPKLIKSLTAAGKLVNINIAFRYNAIDNRTFVYVATPLITSDY